METKKTTTRTATKTTKVATEKAVSNLADTRKDEAKFTQEEVNEMIRQALADFAKTQANSQSPIIQVAKAEESVTLMFTDTIAKGSVVALGNLGQINSSFGTIDIPKKDFKQGKNSLVDKLLEKRKLVVLNGLTDEEAQRYGVEYKDGELLSQTDYYKLLDFPTPEIVRLFSKLCETHQRVVATTFITAYQRGDKRVTQEKVKAINDVSKIIDSDGMLTPILKDMGTKLSQ